MSLKSYEFLRITDVSFLIRWNISMLNMFYLEKMKNNNNKIQNFQTKLFETKKSTIKLINQQKSKVNKNMIIKRWSYFFQR